MKFSGLIFAAIALSCAANAANFGVYSGASYQSVVAPNSWAVAFGSGIALSTAVATPLANGQWPTTLAGTTVEVNGQAAEIYYVSPGQINFLIPDITKYGTTNVLISNAGTSATSTSTVNIQNSSVGIFTSDSTGSGPGAILNGVTGAASPFLVVTPENGGNDLRTRLAIYCTGLRYAGNPSQDPSVVNIAANVTANGIDAAGNQYNFTVEYAGISDPTFPGLDQVNIVLPAQLDGAGVVTLTVTAENITSNKVTFQMNSLPASEIALAMFTLSTNETVGGSNVTGTLLLNGVARSPGFQVGLRINDPSTVVPSVVTIPQGQASATFTITTAMSTGVQSDTIVATGGSATLTVSLRVDPSDLPQLAIFTFMPTTVPGGTNLSGTVGLSGAAPVGGINVQLASSDTVVQAPSSVTVPSNTNTENFTIPTSAVTIAHTVTLTATLGSNTLTQQVTVAPPVQITLSDSSVTGGTSVQGTIALATAPTAAINIDVTSSATGVASSPGLVNVPAGQTTATFTITTFSVTAAHTVTITANDVTVGTATASLTVNPPTVGQLQSVSVSPAQVTGGAEATGTVSLSGPAKAGGQIVTLKASNILAASVPSVVTVAPGSTSATFTIMTNAVATKQTVTITATAGSISETATLTVE